MLIEYAYLQHELDTILDTESLPLIFHVFFVPYYNGTYAEHRQICANIRTYGANPRSASELQSLS